MSDLRVQAERLRQLHDGAAPLILPNAWDVASARAVERAGASAIATSSSAVADSLGFEDGDRAPADEMFAAVRRMADGVAVPVTADAEGGYGLEPPALLQQLVESGAAGLNIEDSDRGGSGAGLLSVERQAARIRGIRTAAEAIGIPLVINARIDVYLRGSADLDAGTREAIERGRAYLAAGADCIYPIWLIDGSAIAAIVRELSAPVNVLLRPGCPGVAALADMGVRRISVGSGLASAAMQATGEIARRLLRGDDAAFQESP